jgi:hypothetical protein
MGLIGPARCHAKHGQQSEPLRLLQLDCLSELGFLYLVSFEGESDQPGL